MKNPKNLAGHFRTITRHKLLVMRYCFQVGLYRQGLAHDLSKYSPTDFFRGVRYYQGDHSPNDEERRQNGASLAWMHHKGRNRHHYEYWTDYRLGAPAGTMGPVKMPLRYVVEMFCDRVAASQIYNGGRYTCRDPLNYYLRGKGHMAIHPETASLLEGLLRMLARYGQRRTFRFIRARLLPRKTY